MALLADARDEIKQNLGTMEKVCDEIKESSSLKAFLRYVLHTGNFINSEVFKLFN